MKLFILIGLLCSGYCLEKNQDGYKFEERRVAGGGNFGGFIGLTTYGAGPFLVKGKYEADDYGTFGSNLGGYEQGLSLGQGQYYNDGNYERNKERQRDSKRDDQKDKGKKDDDSKKYDGYDVEYIRRVGYEDIQRDQPYYDGRPYRKSNDDFNEYLGYRRGYGYCFGRDREYDRYNNERQTNRDLSDDDDRKRRCDELFGFTGPTANDEPENLMRPCALDDWQCMRKYFAANGKCKPSYGPIPDPLYIDINTFFFPVANITLALPNLRIRGLSSAKTRDFYVNKQSGNLVLALDIVRLNLTVPRGYFRYRRTAKESIVLADYATVELQTVTLTAIIPKVPHLRLDLADIHADVGDSIPPFFIGPGAAASEDPDVIRSFAELIRNLPISIREAALYLSQLVTAIYIQENICDFGLKIISV